MSADIITLPGAGLPDRPITESDIDKLHSEAFRDLESGICDCESMAKIAAQEMFSKYTVPIANWFLRLLTSPEC